MADFGIRNGWDYAHHIGANVPIRARIDDLLTVAGRDGYQIATDGGHIVTAVTIFSRWRPVVANLRSSGGGLEWLAS